MESLPKSWLRSEPSAREWGSLECVSACAIFRASWTFSRTGPVPQFRSRSRCRRLLRRFLRPDRRVYWSHRRLRDRLCGAPPDETIMRILIADDNDAVRSGVVGLLSFEAGWKVCGEARDGSEALQKARELLPDLILLDISMPGMNGLEVARLLRQELPGAKILVISQHDPIQLLPHVVEAGGNACGDKRRLGMDLVARIKSLVGLPGPSRESP